jgi:hypothetical protein
MNKEVKGESVSPLPVVVRPKRKGFESRNDSIDCELYPLKRQFLPVLSLESDIARVGGARSLGRSSSEAEAFEDNLEENAYSYRVQRNARSSSSSDEEDISPREDSECCQVSDTDASDMEGIATPSQRAIGSKWKEVEYSAGSPLRMRAANYNIADEIVEDIIRKTRKAALHSSAPGGAGGRRAVGASLPGWGDPTADRRRGLLLLPPPCTWQGSDRCDKDRSPSMLPDYIGDALGTLYPTNISANSGYGFANTPTHQEFCCVEESESAGAGGTRNSSELMSIDD